MQNVLLNLVVVDVGQSGRLFPSHLLHLGPVEQMVGPPDRFRLRIAILRSFPIIGRPDQPRKVRSGLRRLHLAQGFGQNGDSVSL